MYVIRDIFQLKFGQFKEVKTLVDEGKQLGIFTNREGDRILTDFTGDAYRLILERTFESLAAYENEMKTMGKPEWQAWYGKFKEHMIGSHREILKLIA